MTSAHNLFTPAIVATVMALGPSLSPAQAAVSTGTGFIVNERGDVVTNHHVISHVFRDGNGRPTGTSYCQRTLVSNGLIQRTDVSILAYSAPNDLAVLRPRDPSVLFPGGAPAPRAGSSGSGPKRSGGGMRSITGEEDMVGGSEPMGGPVTSAGRNGQAFAIFRDAPLRQGEAVSVVGYPYGAILSSQAKITSGLLSSTAGLRNDTTRFQTSAPVNPGNSGGPIFDQGGLVIGAAVEQVAKRGNYRGSENNNFGIKSRTIRQFLDDHGVAYRSAASAPSRPWAEVFEAAAPYTVRIKCFLPDGR